MQTGAKAQSLIERRFTTCAKKHQLCNINLIERMPFFKAAEKAGP